MSGEQVLVMPAATAFSAGVKPGFTRNPGLASKLIDATHEQMFRPRDEVETQPHWLQLIPYCVLVNEEIKVFVYERGGSGCENRLHRKISIGIGGHINPIDASGDGCEYSAGLYREIVEEVDIEPEFSIGDPIGLIYDDSNDVGRVHLGIVHLVYVGDSTITPMEDSIDAPMMLSAGSLLGRRDKMEVWSQLCIDHLVGKSKLVAS